jgi:hypothetical protein
MKKENIWSSICGGKLWPKVATLLWMVAHRNILAKDYIFHKGFAELGFCIMSGQDNETMEHLLN